MATRYIIRETPEGRPVVPRVDLGIHTSKKAAKATAARLSSPTDIYPVRRSHAPRKQAGTG